MEEEIKEETPQSPEILPVKQKKPWLMITLIALIVIIFGAIGVFAYQNYLLKNRIQTEEKTPVVNLSPVPTSIITITPETAPENWETFISGDNVFSFSYPESWRLHLSGLAYAEVDCSAYGAQTQPEKPCDPSYNLGSFNITGTAYKSLDEVLSDEEYIKQFSEKEITSFQGYKTIKFVYPGSEQAGGSYLRLFIEYKGKVYLVTMIYRNLFNAEHFSQFEKPNPDILSTLKFY